MAKAVAPTLVIGESLRATHQVDVEDAIYVRVISDNTISITMQGTEYLLSPAQLADLSGLIGWAKDSNDNLQGLL
jgi:hypothetical protein